MKIQNPKTPRIAHIPKEGTTHGEPHRDLGATSFEALCNGERYYDESPSINKICSKCDKAWQKEQKIKGENNQ